MSHGELTCFKLILSALTAAVGAMLVEGLFVQAFAALRTAHQHPAAAAAAHAGGGAAAAAAPPLHGGGAAAGAHASGEQLPWWEALAALETTEMLGLLGGSALVLIFQVGRRAAPLPVPCPPCAALRCGCAMRRMRCDGGTGPAPSKAPS